MRELLLGYLLETLEPKERAEVEHCLRSDPRWKQELEQLRESLRPLSEDLEDFEPPEDLTKRTLELIEDHSKSYNATPYIIPSDAPVPARGQWQFQDTLVAGCIITCICALMVPAILHTRFESQVVYCQYNLESVGMGLSQYSQLHQGYYPTMGGEVLYNQADFSNPQITGAAVCGPKLLEGGFVDSAEVFICPTSTWKYESDSNISKLSNVSQGANKELFKLKQAMGGSYGYSLGYIDSGVYQNHRNQGRSTFPVSADSPSLHLKSLQSANHSGFGQNVLFEAGNVQFWKSPSPRQNQDNLFTNQFGFVGPGRGPNDVVIGQSTAVPIVPIHMKNIQPQQLSPPSLPGQRSLEQTSPKQTSPTQTFPPNSKPKQ